ncbi:MAG: M15 family metallopeptidase [Verrucomicrobiae bacterium]
MPCDTSFSISTPEQSANSKRLEEEMTAAGFEPFPTEWWHFDLKNWKSYPVLSISIEDLERGDSSWIPAD